MAKVLQLEGLSLDQVGAAFRDLIYSLENADAKVELAIANSLWANNIDVYEDFLQRCRDNFGAEVSRLDFGNPGAVAAINKWVSENTKGKIGKIVDRLSTADIFVLLNAVYFNGKWLKPFDKNATNDEEFHLLDGSTKKVPMMHQRADFGYFENE